MADETGSQASILASAGSTAPTATGPALSRRRFLGGTVAATAALGLGPVLSACTPSSARNVMMIYVDDLRDWVGYMGSHPGVKTPNIDALRAESFAFNRAFCAVPSCLGSRASTMWGLRPSTTGVDTTIAEGDRAYGPLVASAARTIPEVLSNRGWTTYNRGKVFHNALPDRWDVAAPYPEIQELLDTSNPTFWQTLFDYGVLPSGEVHTDQATVNWFIQQLQSPELPFFMAVGLYQPHVPWRVPQWAYDQHPIGGVVVPQPNCVDDLADVPPTAVELAARPRLFGTTNEDLIEASGQRRALVQAYLASITHTDAMIGQLLNALADSPHGDDTSVLLVSDHGYHLGEKLHWRKSTLWEQATRTPLLVRSPGLAPGGVSGRPVSLIDVAPTVLDAAGASPHPGFEGQTLLGLTTAQADARPAVMQWQGNRSIRWRRWRYTTYVAGGEELYDLSADPSECTNLSGDPAYASTLNTLQNLLSQA